jgi:IS605 OrfB family transposase
MRVCAVDLNINDALAVCTIQQANGTVVATRFIRGGRKLHDRRKRLLGMAARNRRKTGIIAENEQDNAHLWAKIRHIGENEAHRVSKRIVEFAQEHSAVVIVFEHLGHFQPKRGKYSRRANDKRSYWLRGRIFHDTRYKAWEVQIITSRVNPHNTSQACAACGQPVARYGAGETPDVYRPGAPLFYCPACGRRGNADHNASVNIGQRLFARYLEKPHIRQNGDAPKGAGIPFPQDAGDEWGGCIPSQLSNGTGIEMGKAPPVLGDGVQAGAQDGIPRLLRSRGSSGYAAGTSEDRLRGSAQRSPRL